MPGASQTQVAPIVVRELGRLQDVRVDLVQADAVSAPADLAIAGMFTHEMAASAPTGGLAHLNEALGGALVRLRSDGIFSAQLGEMLTLSAVGHPVAAPTVMVVGMGDPEDSSPSALSRAAAAAFSAAVRADVRTAAFAPGLLDSGLEAGSVEEAPIALIRGLTAALMKERPASLQRWMFCSGVARFDEHAREMRRAFVIETGGSAR